MKLILSPKNGVLECLYKALHEPLGLHLTTEADIKLVRSWFYLVMRQRAPEFSNLVLVNTGDALFILRKDLDRGKEIERTPDPSYDPLDVGDL